MSILRVSFPCLYLTETDGVQWNEANFKVRAIVRGMKQEAFNGYVTLRKRRYTEENIHEFVPLFASDIGTATRRYFSPPISIVPIPNSSMHLRSEDTQFRIVELASLVAKGYGEGATVAPILRWKAMRAPAHRSRKRRTTAGELEDLSVVGTTSNPIVLFDDVLTSGSQMTAAAILLRKAGFQVLGGIVGARATKNQDPKMIAWRTEDLDAIV